jgi:N-acetyl-anhydromuramyl-L-alanine amidase AmpD
MIKFPYPFMQARFLKRFAGRRPIRLIVIHSMEAPEKGTTAEAVAKYFQSGQVKASAHLCIDNDSIIQCVPDNDIAGAAPGANHDGLHIELAGYARQTREEWLDDYGKAMLELAAQAAARWAVTYDIPIRQLTNFELGSHAPRGFVPHAQVSAVFKQSNHTDPGPAFPWDYFLQQTRLYAIRIREEAKP